MHLDSYITLQEFGDSVALCDHEIDLAMDRIRQRLLRSVKAPYGGSAGASAAGGSGKPDGQSSNKLRDHRQLSQVFTMVNTSGSGILSLEELLTFAAQIEFFITEQEARKMLSLMDVGNDERVAESDFIEFMRKSSDVLTKKAQRLRINASKIRTWLQRSQAGAGSLAQRLALLIMSADTM